MLKPILLPMAVLWLLLASAAQADTLAKIKATGVVAMGVRESSGALSYALGAGQFAGFHVELCQRVLADIQKALGLGRLEIRYVPVTSQNRIPLVQNGTVDIECGSTTHNSARAKDVAFAVTTYMEEVRIAVKRASGINSFAQLDGRKVSTTTGTTSVQHLRRHERAAGLDIREVYGKDHADSFLLLATGRADAFVMDAQILAANIARSRTPGEYAIVGEALSVEPIALMLRKDDPAFKQAVDDRIKALMASGEIAKIYDRWFMQPVPPANARVGLPASEATRAAWARPNDLPLESYTRQ